MALWVDEGRDHGSALKIETLRIFEKLRTQIARPPHGIVLNHRQNATIKKQRGFRRRRV